MEPINVLWVEDDPQVVEAYPMEAELYGIVLHNVDCWDDAHEALQKNYDFWNAIILDAKCKHHRDSMDNAVKFLSEALSDLKGFAAEKQRTIPWYILTGGSEDELLDSITDTRLEWDDDWPRKYYSKNTDREILFKRIKYHASISEYMMIKNQFDKILFEAIERTFSDTDIEVSMLDLLHPIYFPNSREGKYNDLFNKARSVIEQVFYTLIEFDVVPDSEYYIDWRKKVNLTNVSNFIRGLNSNSTRRESLVPRVLGEIIKNTLSICSSASHRNKFADSKNDYNTRQFLEEVNDTPYLLRSVAFQLCDIIIWFDQYLQDHPNKEGN